MKERIVVTGMGIISALGRGTDATSEALIKNIGGVHRSENLPKRLSCFPVGEVFLSNKEMAHILSVKEPISKLRTVLLGLMAAREAISSAGLTSQSLNKCAFVNGTTVGGMDRTEQIFKNIIEERAGNDECAELRYNDCGCSTEFIAKELGRFALITTTSTACSSAANAIVLGARLLEDGRCNCALVGGSEALTLFHMSGFNSLMILDSELCRPFREDRAGINLGEGAAYLVIERESSAKKRGATILAVLSGYGNACDAYHQTATSPNGDGPYLAMKRALSNARLQPCDIDFINAHGTGTPNNDSTELQAMKRIWGENIPPFVSTKSLAGHTTSASGAIESVISILSLSSSTRHVLNNSFGFGGNDTSLIFSNPENINKNFTFESEESGQKVYVLSVAQASCQQPLTDDWFRSPIIHDVAYAPGLPVNVKDLVSPAEARRMTALLKRCVASAFQAKSKAEVHQREIIPEAIITATGLGCMDISEKFLGDMCANGEDVALKPSLFMNSTHNTLSSLIAILMHNHGYNNTYSHGDLGFESALLDAFLGIKNCLFNSALVSAHDETTPLMARIMPYTHPSVNFASDLSVATVLSGSGQINDSENLVQLNSVNIMNGHAKDVAAVVSKTQPDIVIIGSNGKPENDNPYNQVLSNIQSSCPSLSPTILHYKHIFGENYSASAAAFLLGVKILEEQYIPSLFLYKNVEPSDCRKINRITIVNSAEPIPGLKEKAPHCWGVVSLSLK